MIMNDATEAGLWINLAHVSVSGAENATVSFTNIVYHRRPGPKFSTVIRTHFWEHIKSCKSLVSNP